MKPSDSIWINNIPSEWDMYRLKFLIDKRDNGAWGEEETNNSNDVICIRVADFDYQNSSIKNNDFTYRNYDKATIKKLQLEKGDILIEKSGGGEKTPVGRTVIFNEDFDALFSNFVERLRTNRLVVPGYLQFLFVAMYQDDITKQYIKQTTGIQNLDLTSLLANEKFCVPSLSEQQVIAKFLESECSKINSIINDMERQVEILNQHKKSLITETVTKGLDKTVQMKTSEVEWIGHIPEHWEIKRLKYHLDSVESGTSVNAANFPAEVWEYGVLKTSCVYHDRFSPSENKKVNDDEIDLVSCRVKKDRLIVSRMNTPEWVGACGYVDENYNNLFLPDRLWQVKFKENIVCKYAWYYLTSIGVRNWIGVIATGSSNSMKNISQTQFGDLPFISPIYDEQHEIVKFLDDRCSKIDAILGEKQQSIETMKQYKKSLIFEYVTGKKRLKEVEEACQ
ncbi:restriction endonuclease subunit S [[Bacillus] enclensis]|nr:restriction endonuclease subunit S [[Bacillus] enclensis]